MKSHKLTVHHLPCWRPQCRPCSLLKFHYKGERETDGLSSETHPAHSQTLSLVCFSPIQSTDSEGMQINAGPGVAFPVIFQHTRQLLEHLKYAPRVLCAKLCVQTLCLRVLHQTFMRSYIIQVKHHTNMLTVTCCIFQPKPPKQIHTSTHTHTHKHNIKHTLNWEWWWDTVTAPGERSRKSVVLISHLWYKQLCDSS